MWMIFRRATSALMLYFFCSQLTAQTIRVLDESNQRPIADVFIVSANQEFARFSNSKGIADISEFPNEGKITFQHPAFLNIETTKEEITNRNLVVYLKETIEEFDEVTVTANKWQQSNSEVPNDILPIKSEDIAFSNAPTSADILSNSGQVFLQKSQLGGGSPTLRGFAANAVLLVIDGIRMNNAIYRSGNLQNVINIDPNIIERTEVVFGPGSVIYGSDALGGVMDFQTKTPRWHLDGGTEFKANGMLRYSSAANEKTGHFDLTVGQEKITYFGSFTYTDFDDLKSGKNRSEAYEGFFERNFVAARENGRDVLVRNDEPHIQRESGYNLINALQKLRWRTSDRTELTYSYFISTTSDIPRYDRLTQPLSVGSDSLLNAEWYYGPQTWQMHAIKFNSYAPTNIYDQMQVTSSFQFYEESRHDRQFGDDRLRNRKEEVEILTLNVDFEKSVTNGSIFYGLDGFFNNVNSQARRRNINTGEITAANTRYPNGGSQFYSAALYGGYKWNISKKWILNIGSRYSTVALTANNQDEDISDLSTENADYSNQALLEDVDLFNQALTGSLGVVFSPANGTKLSGVISSGFRAPNVDDVGKIFEINSDAIVIPNTELKPEYVYNQEIGWDQSFADSGVQFRLVGYHSYLTNAIVRGETDFNGAESLLFEGQRLELRSQVNARRARIYGGSAQVKVSVSESLDISSTLNINEGYEIETDEPLRHATPVFGRSTVSYQKGPFKSDFFIDYHASKSADNIPSSEILDKDYLYTDDGSPAWSTINLRFGYAPSSSVSFESGVENILDTHYRTYSSGISAPGRNIYFSVRGSL